MSKKSTSLFLKYFRDFLIIMLLFIIIISVLFSYFIYNYANTNKKLYRSLATEQANQIITNILDDCSTIFSSLSTNSDIITFENLNQKTISEIERYNWLNRIQSTLTDKITNCNYVSAIYIYSPKNNYALSHKTFKRTDDFSNYIIYNENLLVADDFLNYTTSIATTNNSIKYILLNRTLDTTTPNGMMCIIILNATMLKNNVSKILHDNDCSFFIWDNLNDVPITNSLLDGTRLHEIHQNIINGKKPTFFKRNQSINLYKLSDYNWDCIYIYDNSSLNKEILQTICWIIPLSFISLSLGAVFLSYRRAKKTYLPINKIVDILNKQKNNINISDIASNYSYTEINYITETLINNIKDKNKLQKALEKKIKQLNDANKYVLEVQIQPHFIFNTLEIIYLESCKLLGKKNIVPEMIYNLADLLRVTLRNDNKFIPIGNELNYTKKYLYIQNIRFEDSFEVIYNIDENTENLLTPKLILQPIVENSIKHGIIPASRKCFIKISNYIENERVIFIIEDNGVGMTPERLHEICNFINDDSSLPVKNIGIANVNMRIKLIFGDDFGCEIISSDSNGTKIKISIPVITL